MVSLALLRRTWVGTSPCSSILIELMSFISHWPIWTIFTLSMRKIPSEKRIFSMRNITPLFYIIVLLTLSIRIDHLARGF